MLSLRKRPQITTKGQSSQNVVYSQITSTPSTQQPQSANAPHVFIPRRTNLQIKGRRQLLRYLKVILVIMMAIVFYALYSIPTTSQFISKSHGFHPDWHPLHRSQRFPSIQDRVRIYMSPSWFHFSSCKHTPEKESATGIHKLGYTYLTHQNDDGNMVDGGSIRVHRTTKLSNSGAVTLKRGAEELITLSSTIQADQSFVMSAAGIENCQKSLYEYCHVDGRRLLSFWENEIDTLRTTNNGLGSSTSTEKLKGGGSNESDESTTKSRPPLIVQFGDSVHSDLTRLGVPYFSKARRAISKFDWEHFTSKHVSSNTSCDLNYQHQPGSDYAYPPILWRMKDKRHIAPVIKVLWSDIPWHKKKSMAVWRGVITGDHKLYRRHEADYNGGKPMTFMERCNMLSRCKFVFDHRESTVVDVGISKQLDYLSVPSEYNHVMKGELSFHGHLRYKAIIVLEGNDVATGLKWALFSRSVVLQAPPTKVSYAMEEILEPWVHYVPLKSDLSDVEEKMKWIEENDQEAQKIAERATLFIYDLLYHEDAEKDRVTIERDMLHRYSKLFIDPAANLE